MRTVALTDETRRSWADASQPRPIALTVWEPEGAGPHPLTLLSHGTGGRASDLGWLAEALVAAGHIVIGPDHHGNTSTHEYLPEGFAFMWERPRDVSRGLDWALDSLAVDAEAVYAAGFSLGGYTCAALAGGRIDPRVLGAIMAKESPMPPLPEMPDLIDRLAQKYPAPVLAGLLAHAGDDVADERIHRVVMLAPSLGQLVSGDSLSAAATPALILWGDADQETAPEVNAKHYLAAMPHAVGRSMGADVEHYWWWADHPMGTDLRAEASGLIRGFLSSP
ncbi:alpha/beta hydrolase family protein [Demequina globuliformis]|uniref:alpha/beta hydrolase family protein n=1 Tax=Demequina globuliformis TaxID=676202 RepID=UPI000782C9A9|nr:hypothetical protein [Demequina globuliformis]